MNTVNWIVIVEGMRYEFKWHSEAAEFFRKATGRKQFYLNYT